jgi:hypothetical protein
MFCTATRLRLPSTHLPAPIAPRWSRLSECKNAHRGLSASCRAASRPTRSQVSIASGENSRRCTKARRTPLLPQGNQWHPPLLLPQDPLCHQPLRGGGTVSGNVQYLRQLQGLLTQFGAQNPAMIAFLTWFQNVAPGGAWDFKANGGTRTDDMMGNFNFGATGTQFFNSTTILSGAGVVQLATNPSAGDGGIPFVSPPYGDDNQGQQEISAGINGGC